MKYAMLLTAFFASFSCQAAELTLTIHGDNLGGKTLMIRLFDSKAGFPSGRNYVRNIKTVATSDSTTLQISDVAPGSYALAVFADDNNNGRLDRNLFGIPAEPYGFSNDARSLIGPPGFASAAFELKDGGAVQSIHLH